MNIKSLVKKLRNAADVLEELFITDTRKETKKTADKIKKKLHWTQTPEGRRIMSKRTKLQWAKKAK